MYTISDLKDGVSGILTGLNLGNVTNLYGAFERAARTIVLKADVPEATGKQSVTLYDHVYDVLAPAAIFGGAVFDFRPQGTSRDDLDRVYKTGIEVFDRTKATLPNGVELTFEYVNGTPIMRAVSARTTARAVLDPMSSTSGWTAAGSASGLAQDSTDYYESPASLRFTLTGASVGTLTKTISAGDMSTYQGVGVVFLAIKLPAGAGATDLSSVAIRLGSSASAYTTVTSTTGYLGAWTVGDWLLVALDLSTGSDTGTPNYASITYLQVRLTHGVTITNFRVGGIWAALPSPYTLIYGTSAIFLPSGSTTPSRTISSDTDSIILNDAAYLPYTWECAQEIALQQGGKLSNGTIQTIQKRLEEEIYPRYKANNPSQQLRTLGSWYE